MSSSTDSVNHGDAKSNGTVGVQELIDRLKLEGVQEGQEQADALLAESKKQAAAIVEDARIEADKIVKEAQHEAERMHTNGKRALTLSARDTQLELKEQIQHEFRSWIGQRVEQQLADAEFLPQLIREAAAQAITAVGDHAGPEDSDQPARLRLRIGGGESKALEAFVSGEAAEMLRRGVHIQVDRSLAHGFRLQHLEDNIEIDFTDQAVTAALMRFLAPKFRQLIGTATANE